MWESRVLRRAFERLELHEGKLSRAVLRGGGGGDVTSLPDPGWGTTQVYPARAKKARERCVGLSAISSLLQKGDSRVMSLGHPSYPRPKGTRNHSMAEKRGMWKSVKQGPARPAWHGQS